MTKTDRDIADAIAHELEWDARIGANTIDVQVQRGAVVLDGAIASWAQRLAAQDAALRVDGVRDVSNRIEVVLPREARRSDVELARSVQAALDWDVLVPKGKISSSVNGGQVILEGQVDVCAQRDEAERAVRNIVGILAESAAWTIGCSSSQVEVPRSVWRYGQFRSDCRSPRLHTLQLCRRAALLRSQKRAGHVS